MNLGIENLVHTYMDTVISNQPILQVPSWMVTSSEQILICGLTGSGKTTLLNILAGQLKPTKGQIWLGNQSLYPQSKLFQPKYSPLRGIGYIRETPQLLPDLTALENVENRMILAKKFPASLCKSRAIALLGQLGLLEIAKCYPLILTLGQQTLVEVACAIANMPKLILFDDPTTNLNHPTCQFVLGFLQETCHWYDATLIVTTSNPTLAVYFERVFDLCAGYLEEIAPFNEGTMKSIIKRHQPHTPLNQNLQLSWQSLPS